MAVLLSAPGQPATAAEPRPVVTGLKNPTALVTTADGRVYVATAGDLGKDGDGAIYAVDNGKAVPFASGLGSPHALAAWGDFLFVADKQQVWKVGRDGKPAVLAAAAAFPSPPKGLTHIDAGEEGVVYVADAGGSVFRIDPKGKVTAVADPKRTPGLGTPAGLVLDGASFLLVLDGDSGALLRVKVADGSSARIADGFGAGGGLTWDRYGRLFVGDRKDGRLFAIPRPGIKPVRLTADLPAASGIAVAPDGRSLLVPDPKAGTLLAVPAAIPGWEVDDRPLPLATEVAFPDLQWTGWKGETEKGVIVPLRPLVLTHAGDGSDRVFVATQHGVIHVFPNDQKATKTKIFLDIQDRVVYDDNQNEEGLLGLAFHPQYKKNGEFFVFYTTKKAKGTNLLSRFRVSKDDPDRADPASEEVLLRIERPFWNHDGGTLCFGPDGYLYVALGDGGAANDPYNNGQNLGSLLGKVLRLDVDRKDAGKNYAVPADNPFVKRQGARPEIWAYGLRNVWRMAFDRKTGKLWASDVGQNLYEEIDHLTAGGNFGWRVREGLHPFGPEGVGPRKDLVDPIWEYHHDVGKSLTGGAVYRGKRLPELEGAYLYADYVTMKVWALWYDESKGRVVANRRIPDPGVPVMSFGEDERGDAYFMTYTPTGRGIYRFVRAEGKGKK
jgi:glucose/arabinose dehydrogenase